MNKQFWFLRDAVFRSECWMWEYDHAQLIRILSASMVYVKVYVM